MQKNKMFNETLRFVCLFGEMHGFHFGVSFFYPQTHTFYPETHIFVFGGKYMFVVCLHLRISYEKLVDARVKAIPKVVKNCVHLVITIEPAKRGEVLVRG